jgi:hypothetical protein
VGGYGSYVQLIRTDALYAGSVWANYINSNASIEVEVDIAASPIHTADGTSATAVFLKTQNDNNYFEFGTIAEMLTGQDPNGSAPDIIIHVDPQYIDQFLYFDPNPTPTSNVPSNKVDAVEVFEHELGHAFGFNGYLDLSTGASQGSLSTYDVFVTTINGTQYFTGPQAKAIYGGPVPLTTNNFYHVGNQAGSGHPGSDLLTDMMNGVIGFFGKSPGPSKLDLAILADAGVPMLDTVSINDVSITEGDSGTKIGTFTVTRSGGTAAFDVSFTTSDNTATVADHDYLANAGTLHFAAGVNTQTISVTINGDTKLESGETFHVNLSGATNGAVISDNSALGTIADDDGTRSPHEFNGDGNNDFLWRNDDGSVATWDMNDHSSSGAVIASVSNDWHIADTGDFNGDGKSDILWRNDSGAVATWNMNDRSYDGLVIGTVTNDWHIAGTGDFNGDHKTDILWRNDNGSVATWDMNDRSSSGAVIATVTNDWHIAGIGDFNGDGKTDILWRNDSGAVATWDMNDRSSSGAVIGTVTNDWHIAGTGDFNGDGKTDILWRNDSGAVATWDMNDRNSSGVVIANVSNDWHIAGTGDFNGDGKTDILWRNDSGAVATWDMDDRSYGGVVIATVPNDWHIA